MKISYDTKGEEMCQSVSCYGAHTRLGTTVLPISATLVRYFMPSHATDLSASQNLRLLAKTSKCSSTSCRSQCDG